MLASLRLRGHLLLLLLMLLLTHLLFHVIIIAIVDILNVHNILVFFVLSVIVITEQDVVSRVDTHHSTAATCIHHLLVDDSLLNVTSRLLTARRQRTLVISLSIVGTVSLFLLHLIHVGCDVLCDC